jgi:hypothetical protein
MSDSNKYLIDILEEQNKAILELIPSKFKDVAKRMILNYDWSNSSLPKDDEILCDYYKLTEFNKIYVENRENFLKIISKYLR